MNKPCIVTDLDGCCIDLQGGIERLCREKFSLVMPPIEEYDLSKWIGAADGSTEQKEKAKAETFRRISGDGDFYFNLEPYPGAQKAMADLSEHFRIVALTSRSIDVRGATKKAIIRDFPMIDPADVHVTKGRLKAKNAQTFNPWYVIEDHPGTVEDYLKAKIRTFYVRRSYGRDVSVRRGMNRLYTVPDVQTAVGEILRLTGKIKEEQVA
jgi:5'(3')-deoxyribonucleotidase